MKYATHRFRIAKPGASAPRQAVSPGAVASALNPSRSAASSRAPIPACDRCRRLKKRCSRQLPECQQCVHAGQKCTLLDPAASVRASPKQLQSRIEFLTRYIEENLPRSPQAEENGADSPIAYSRRSDNDQSPLSEAEKAQDAHVSDTVARITEPSITSPCSTTIDEQNTSAQRNSPQTLLEVFEPARPWQLDFQYIHAQNQNYMPFVNAYFRHVHRAYPFIDRKRVMLTANNALGHGLHSPTPDFRILNLIMAIGYTTLKRAGKVTPSMPPPIQVDYTQIIEQCLSEENEDSVRSLMLLALYSLFDPKGLSTWSIVGILTRQAMILGLTRKIGPTENRSPQDAELRCRLAWSIFNIDRMMAVSVGQPVGLTDNNMNIPQPAITVEEFASPERTEVASMLQLSRNVIQLRQLEYRIISEIHLKGRMEISYMTIPDRAALAEHLRAEVENWYSNGCLVSVPEADNVPIHNSITWLNARYYHLLVLLYFPCQFNAQSKHIDIHELTAFLRKDIQYNSVLLSNRQLPLNGVTLNRLIPACLVLLHCYSSSEPGNFAAVDEVRKCLEILRSFPSGWDHAHRAAEVLFEFTDLITMYEDSAANTSTQLTFPSIHHAYRKPTKGAWLQLLRSKLQQILSEAMGKSSCYLSMNEWNDSTQTDAPSLPGQGDDARSTSTVGDACSLASFSGFGFI